MQITYSAIDSAIGPLAIAAKDGRLCLLDFASDPARIERRLEKRFGPVELEPVADPGGFVSRLWAYWAGDLDALDGIPVAKIRRICGVSSVLAGNAVTSPVSSTGIT